MVSWTLAQLLLLATTILTKHPWLTTSHKISTVWTAVIDLTSPSATTTSFDRACELFNLILVEEAIFISLEGFKENESFQWKNYKDTLIFSEKLHKLYRYIYIFFIQNASLMFALYIKVNDE